MANKILIAVPTFENIKPECFKSIYGLKRPEGYDLYFDYVSGYDCAKARNQIAKNSMAGEYDYVLMVYGAEYVKVPIKIVASSDSIVIADNYSKDEIEAMGLDNRFKLELYDELIIE